MVQRNEVFATCHHISTVIKFVTKLLSKHSVSSVCLPIIICAVLGASYHISDLKMFLNSISQADRNGMFWSCMTISHIKLSLLAAFPCTDT